MLRKYIRLLLENSPLESAKTFNVSNEIKFHQLYTFINDYNNSDYKLYIQRINKLFVHKRNNNDISLQYKIENYNNKSKFINHTISVLKSASSDIDVSRFVRRDKTLIGNNSFYLIHDINPAKPTLILIESPSNNVVYYPIGNKIQRLTAYKEILSKLITSPEAIKPNTPDLITTLVNNAKTNYRDVDSKQRSVYRSKNR
jgi:hypothetical protein